VEPRDGIGFREHVLPSSVVLLVQYTGTRTLLAGLDGIEAMRASRS
jgi:hypothetical protein